VITERSRRRKILLVGLRRELDSFPSEKVRQFIGNVSVALDVLEAFEVYGDELERKRRLTKQRRAAQHFLDACAAPTLARPYPIEINTKLDYTLALPDEEAQKFYLSAKAAGDAVTNFLSELEAALKSVKRSARGRSRTDRHGYLRRVAYCYSQAFGEKPTSTPGGKFSNVVALILQHQSSTGRLPEDVSRQVRTAIKGI
jgi:hypothetical protein